MKRTDWLQETRNMRFEEAFSGWREGGSLTQEEEARLLDVWVDFPAVPVLE